jgi:hypothetical protein
MIFVIWNAHAWVDELIVQIMFWFILQKYAEHELKKLTDLTTCTNNINYDIVIKKENLYCMHGWTEHSREVQLVWSSLSLSLSLLVFVLCHVILKFLVFNLTLIHLTINVISRQMTIVLKDITLSYMASIHTYLIKIIIRWWMDETTWVTNGTQVCNLR